MDTESFPPGKYLICLAAFGQNERGWFLFSILTSAIIPECEIYAGDDPGKLRITAMQEGCPDRVGDPGNIGIRVSGCWYLC